MAFPASVPGAQTSRIAFKCSFSQVKVSGRPLNNTATIGLPVLANALNNSCWVSGMLISERLEDSPVIFADSPTTATTTSAFLAVLTASSIISCAGRLSRTCFIPKNQARSFNNESSVKFDPLAYNIFTPAPAAFFIPSITLTDFSGSPATTQVPNISE